ncbi:DUF2570 domain-containing protein [Yersinia pseudotuberculosis]|uniref:DUF2570 domain-containing protein n=1 Tax=Yersinia pseudotuberculosis TaxID=633 RepID=UPI0003468789|nr:DUF2570 domain-containing protein [Yersinia pseudotuberculosis]QES99943.1 DUF2570 domain-containing protein [Yersinia pseudotuberculosis]CFU92242.1 putative phage antitermination protein Q [Yersinia pseudotuberculosis]CNB54664.1 putative phage antitermination protein Q [Yersinia pseudotuberculosis]CNB78004.1 putative phage antitermination protein Q [Yersinia pseudotuberculosis]CRY60416.1 putative phage antitermination protein Q [Yersinia pseudotuberculosis]
MSYKILGGIITALVASFLLLLVQWSNLSKQIENKEKELVTVREANVVLKNILDIYHVNDMSNRVATARQLENEKVLRNEYEENIRQFKAATIDDFCAAQYMPDRIINLLQE